MHAYVCIFMFTKNNFGDVKIFLFLIIYAANAGIVF